MQCNPGQALRPRRRAETHNAEGYVPLGHLGYTLYRTIANSSSLFNTLCSHRHMVLLGNYDMRSALHELDIRQLKHTHTLKPSISVVVAFLKLPYRKEILKLNAFL